ncbi:3-phosphoserine/phosphohydroxythreonine transaminase [Liquorilactobacillus cacaonum]|uniref:Phosphoserine aminotransferase n=1 Tax=Liquorilactobacillus cacaonum DSM 21116 TaxID=1423729 RepID=A0A0R2CXK7_9LACO|nr:3-phosphoserine/phosphohydroxythreonine transaminase [Liquorilactobacillus cacaonum]KRM92227.1 3-phosphoserine phosphohydroxythreonine aminotransferase [Liquorilactobacillus cacaonum DSM 21116]
MAKIYNFSAGPAVMPKKVLEKVQTELLSYKNSGMSVMEISHRSSLFSEIQENAEKNLRRLMDIPSEYDVLFLQGGATLQFTMAPLNFANNFKRIGFINTGHWSQRAIEEANLINGVEAIEIASGFSSGYTKLPEENRTSEDLDYVHITLNNTIEGTAYKEVPYMKDKFLVGDMSSNILGQRYNVSDFGMIYAGAQKNIGPAGLTVVIVRHDLVEKSPNLPAMLSYKKLVNKNSTLNTPPVFAIYCAGLVFEWLIAEGGIDVIEKKNREKAQLLYDFLDNSSLFSSPVSVKNRSITNIPFVTGNSSLDAKFIAMATENGFVGLKGHRLVGGMRASLYNAFPIEGVKELLKIMQKFELEYKGVY